ncbi:hypothetical protein BCV70DRAFT_165644, partial [Testicularia cyperi]
NSNMHISSPRTPAMTDSTFSSPRSLFYESEPSGSTKSSESSEDGHARKHQPQPLNTLRNLRFSSIDYLEDALKLNLQDNSESTELTDLIDLYNSNVMLSQTAAKMAPPVHHVDTIGEEDEMEYVNEKPRYTREQKGKAIDVDSPPASVRSSGISAFNGEHAATVLPAIGLTREDIVFRTAICPTVEPTVAETQEVLVKAFPELCEAPARMFGEDGSPLPPTKKQEITDAEREARKKALGIKFEGKKNHSLLKAVLVLESRASMWKKIGPAPAPRHGDVRLAMPLLPELPNPWDMEITHAGLDINTISGKTRKIFEIPRSRCLGACRKCSGSGAETCGTCRGDAGNECFWCAGTGLQKGRRRCGRCQGQGVLSCMACDGKKASTCRGCEGHGGGEYMGFIEIKIRKVEVPAVAVADLVGPGFVRPDIVRNASIDMLWDLVKTLATKATLKSKRPYLPVSAICTWQQSVSHLAEVKVVQAAKFKKGSKTPLRPEGLRNTLPTKTRYFSLPNDPSIPVSELTQDQFAKQNAPDEAVELQLPEQGAINVSRRLSTMLMGHVSTPSASSQDPLSPAPLSPRHFGLPSSEPSTPALRPLSPMGSPMGSPQLLNRQSRHRPVSQLTAPPAIFNAAELRTKMLRHNSHRASSIRSSYQRPLTAPGVPL